LKDNTVNAAARDKLSARIKTKHEEIKQLDDIAKKLMADADEVNNIR